MSLFLSAALVLSLAADPDADGCKDHPLFTRMPGQHIHECQDREFDKFTFYGDKGKETAQEGHYTMLWYAANEGTKAPSPLAILRNYQAAIKRVGGQVVFEDDRYTTLKLLKGKQELWAMVDTAWTGGYQLHLLEKQEMKQDVVANADAFANDLKATGHAAVYGIYFDFGKAEVKPESDATLGEIAKLLKAEPALVLDVVGHTDNVGGLDSNLKLSQARAEAVVKVLTTKHGIAAKRLKGYGVASLAPVASNKTDEGRAKNRRVELVEH